MKELLFSVNIVVWSSITWKILKEAENLLSNFKRFSKQLDRKANLQEKVFANFYHMQGDCPKGEELKYYQRDALARLAHLEPTALVEIEQLMLTPEGLDNEIRSDLQALARLFEQKASQIHLDPRYIYKSMAEQITRLFEKKASQIHLDPRYIYKSMAARIVKLLQVASQNESTLETVGV